MDLGPEHTPTVALGRSMPPLRIPVRLRASAGASTAADQPNSGPPARRRGQEAGCPTSGRGDANGDVACKAW
eukprot:4859736-Pyramimonas_sp.AAC.1